MKEGEEIPIYLLSWAYLAKLFLVTRTPIDSKQCPKSILISDHFHKLLELHNNDMLGEVYITH
jgi:hypothetical protein